MTEIPDNTVTQKDLELWYEMDKQIKALKGQEMLLRLKIFKGKFVDPKEGTNSVDLPDGFVLKGKRTINRDVDAAALATLREQFRDAGINVDELIRYKPELKVGEYRTLTAEQMLIFDQALVIKDGAPALEIMMPKRRSA
jgi:hypothetical protein